MGSWLRTLAINECLLAHYRAPTSPPCFTWCTVTQDPKQCESVAVNMADDDFFSDLMPTKPAAEASASGLDDIFTEESPVLAQPISEGPGSSADRSNGELASPYARSDAGTYASATNHAPMGLPAAKRDAQQVEAVLQRFSAGLEQVLGETNRCVQQVSQAAAVYLCSLPMPPRHRPKAHASAAYLPLCISCPYLPRALCSCACHAPPPLDQTSSHTT